MSTTNLIVLQKHEYNKRRVLNLENSWSFTLKACRVSPFHLQFDHTRRMKRPFHGDMNVFFSSSHQICEKFG